MANTNTLSENIKVFPAVRRTGSYDPFSRLMSESTITSILNRLIDSSGFVISDNDPETGRAILSNHPFEFNINGYYIKVDSMLDVLSNLPEGAEDIYAKIELNSVSAADMTFTQLVGIDEDEGGQMIYTGVTFSDSNPNGGFSLKILTKENGYWVIPEASKLKFAKNTLELYDIDGGVI